MRPRCTKGASTACFCRRSRASTRPCWGPTRFPITTVAQDVKTIGHTAFGMLMHIREGQPAPATSLVPLRLVVR